MGGWVWNVLGRRCIYVYMYITHRHTHQYKTNKTTHQVFDDGDDRPRAQGLEAQAAAALQHVFQLDGVGGVVRDILLGMIWWWFCVVKWVI